MTLEKNENEISLDSENTIHTDKKYLSEVMDELPTNVILNKGVTGCGGT